MGHSHHHHGAHSNESRVFWAMVITGSFMVLEVIGGLISGSLALLADAGHMFGDFVSLCLAWWAFKLSHKPADAKRSFGYHRFQILAAFVNGLTLLGISVWVIVEAISRVNHPNDIQAVPMLWIAVAGLLANLAAFAVLEFGRSENLNLQGAAAHVLGDLLGSVAAIVAAVLILTLGWVQADAVLSFFVAAMILRVGWGVVRNAGHILLEGTPHPLSSEQVAVAVAKIKGVTGVHHVHVWALTGERLLATLHAVVDDGGDIDQVRQRIEALLGSEFRIDHCTIQLELSACET